MCYHIRVVHIVQGVTKIAKNLGTAIRLTKTLPILSGEKQCGNSPGTSIYWGDGHSLQAPKQCIHSVYTLQG